MKNLQYNISIPWLVGFSDGEGCFHIGISRNKTMKSGYQVIAEFTIVQHVRDLALLEAIRDYLNCGVVKRNRGKSADLPDSSNRINQRWSFCVRKLDDHINIIIPMFEQVPLVSQKRLDFEDFKTVVFMMKQGEHLTPEGLEKIREIKSKMNRGRLPIDPATSTLRI